MPETRFTNKNDKLLARGTTHVESGQIYFKGIPLEELVGKVSYTPLLLHHLLGQNPTQEQIDQLEAQLTRDLSGFMNEENLQYIANTPGDSYNKTTALLNWIASTYERGHYNERVGQLNELHEGLELSDYVDPKLATFPLILNDLPKLYAVTDGREPYHNAETFMESFFINVLDKKPSDISETEITLWDAYLVSLSSHGLTSPSYQGFRVAANAQAPFTIALNSWLAAAEGDVHFGALGESIKDLLEVDERGITHTQHIMERLNNGQRVNGYGHRFHPRLLANYPHTDGIIENHRNMTYDENLQSDPRVRTNFALWDEIGYEGKFTRMVRERAEEAFTLVGCANVDGMAAGLYLDLGLTEEHALLGPFIARIPHLMEIYLRESGEVRPNNYIGLEERRIKEATAPIPRQVRNRTMFEEVPYATRDEPP